MRVHLLIHRHSFTILKKSDLYFEKVKELFSDCYEQEKKLVTSPITVEEYSVYHLKNRKFEYIYAFRAFLEDMEFVFNNVDFDTAFLAAQLRAKYQAIKAMDALQLASAIQSHCDVFLTNDKQLRQVQEIKVLLVDEL